MIFTHIHIRKEGLYNKTTIVYQLKRLCVPDCAHTENIFINSIHISLHDISLTLCILYQIKRDVAVWKILGCPQRNQRTWWQILATPHTGLAKLHQYKKLCGIDYKTNTPSPKCNQFWRQSRYISILNFRPFLPCVLLKMSANLYGRTDNPNTQSPQAPEGEGNTMAGITETTSLNTKSSHCNSFEDRVPIDYIKMNELSKLKESFIQ